MAISVLCVSRGNPRAVSEAAVSFYDTKMEPDSKFCVVLDADDPMLARYMEMLHDVPHDLIVVPRDKSGNMNKALNYAAVMVAQQADVIGFIGDDHRFRTKGWDRVVKKILSDTGGGFVYGDDLAQREVLPTQVFISAPIVRALGWFGLPGARHLYLDNTWKYLGDAAECLYYVPDIVIEHMHPAYGKGQWDENHTRVNSTEMYQHDAKVFEEWLATNMPNDVAKVKAAVGQ